jgi:diguanylate cyclase
MTTANPTALAPSATRPSDEATHRARHKRSLLLNNLRLIAFSYLLDGLAMAMFHLAGTISWIPVLAYTGTGLTLCAVLWSLIGSGWTQRFKDPGIYVATACTNTLVQLVAMYLFPEIGFMFVLILFIVYGSMAMQLPVRQSLTAWALVAIGTGLVLSLNEGRLRIPDGSMVEQVLAAAFFALTLWRCVLLGVYNTSVTVLLKKRSLELAELSAKVEQLAHHDELTGLLNRRSLMDALRDELQRADRQKTPLCAGILDLDKFKAVNDTLGHLAGDKTLKIFATTLKGHTRKSDRFGRYGGEEFLLIMTGTGPDTALVPMDRMRDALAAADWSEVAPGFSMTFSCGIACHEPGETLEALLQRADEALYRAKADGRNCTRLG